MRSLRFKGLRYLTQSLIAAIILCFSSYGLSQPLGASLSLRIGPSVGFPYSIELPSGSDVSLVQRRGDWLLVKDQRGETGWALLADIDNAGGLQERQIWRLKELKQPVSGQLSGQLFTNQSGQGWGLGWAFPIDDYRLSSEYQQSKSEVAHWTSFSTWLTAEQKLSRKTFYRYGLGVGYGLENEESYVLSDKGKASNSAYWGGEFSIGFSPSQKFESGLQLRYLLADLQGSYSSYQVSWYWSLGI
jgi:hypothetical protein